MKNLTIQTRVLLLALVPVIVLTAFLTSYNLNQARFIGEEAVAGFSSDMEESKRQELQNYLAVAKSSIAHLYNQPGSADDPEVREKPGRYSDSFASTIREVLVISLPMTPKAST